jgi:hypothetical protein
MDRDGFSGMMPSFNANGELIMCKILSDEKNIQLIRGNLYKVTIQLPYGEKFQDTIIPDYSFNLNIGGRVIGRGTIWEIIVPNQ